MQLHRLSNFGEARNLDLHVLSKSSLENIKDKYFGDKHGSEGYRIRHIEERGRTLFVKVNKGPQNTGGEAYDPTTGEGFEISPRSAMLGRMRAMLALPKDSYYGLLFAERQGNRNLKEIIRNQALYPNAIVNDTTIHIDNFAEYSDWQKLLKDQKALSLTEYLEIRDSTHDSSTASTPIKLIAEGPRINRITKGVLGAITARAKRNEEYFDTLSAAADLSEEKARKGKAFSVSDNEELAKQRAHLKTLRDSPELSEEITRQLRDAIPIEIGEKIEHKSYQVVTGEEKPERTFNVDRNTMPQFVYETQGIFPDNKLLDLWVAHAEIIFRSRGVSLPKGWATPEKTPDAERPED